MQNLVGFVAGGWARAMVFLEQGGPIVWAIAGVSILALTVILWKLAHLARLGVWRHGRRTERAVVAWQGGALNAAQAELAGRRSSRAIVASAALSARTRAEFTLEDAEKDVERIAKAQLAEARSGLKLMELIATIAPLLGLLGTVVGMIAAFQALQEAGARADPSALAGGIWEALLTTAAGMAVAIPVTMALSWFESQVDRLRLDIEDIATRILLPRPGEAFAPMDMAAQ